jgi:[acyl-carrier-protein] S-malonyltransferase
MAGHSLGEFSALCCAGAIAFADALRLVRRRGALMQSAVPVGEGAMAAVLGLPDSTIVDVCAGVTASPGYLVQAVNFNSPGQVVIAGHTAAVTEAAEALKEAGARRVMPLPVSAPFHTSLMQSAGEHLQEVLDGIDIKPPEVPVLHNVHARSESDPSRIRELLVKQIASPVQWTSSVQAMVAKGVRRVVECGPGKVLGGLNRRIDSGLSSHFMENPAELEALSQLLSPRSTATAGA